jgi:outer membrane protein assembly factor BamB
VASKQEQAVSVCSRTMFSMRMLRFRLFSLTLSILLAAPLAHAEAVSGAKGDWPLWRGTPQHTGYQALPGSIGSPSVAWRQYIGGRVVNAGLLFSRESSGDILYAAPSGNLSSFFADGRTRWTRRYVQQAAIIGVYDLENDGRRELVVAQTPSSRTSIDVFDAATGDLIWSSPAHEGSIGTVKVADIDGDHVQEIVWAPANATFIAAYRVRRIGPTGQVWKTTIADYISDPYTPSSLAIGDITGDNVPDVVIAGGRARIALMVFDGHNGALQGRTDVDLPSGRLQESGGFGQSVVLADIDGDGTKDLVLIGSYGQNSSYMFQGVITATWANWDTPRVLETYPYGMTFADGSVADFDGDGRVDILVSRFNEGRRAHVLTLLDARTLSVKGEIDGYQLVSVVDAGKPSPMILGFLGATVEIQSGPRDLGAVRFENGAFHPLDWTWPNVVIPRSGGVVSPRPDIDNPGLHAVAVDVNGDGVSELILEQVLVSDPTGQTGTRTLKVIEPATGRMLRSFEVPYVAGEIAAAEVGSGANTRFAVAYNTGEIFLGDERFNLARIQVGGFFRAQTNEGHATELPVVADLNGDGTNEIYLATSSSALARIDVKNGVPSTTEILRVAGSPRLLAIATPEERSLVVGGSHPVYQLRKIDWTGRNLWSVLRPAEMPSQVDLNVGRFGPYGTLGVITAGGTTFPLPMYQYDLGSARLLWRGNEGPSWDGTFAVADFDGDGVDDIASNFNTAKGRIVSGLDGGTIAEPSGSPKFRDLVYVDYNGSPVIFDANGDGFPEILDAEDNAHMMMLRVSMARRQSSILWSREQVVLDDERWSMPGIAPVPNSAPMIGVGTIRGVLLGIDSSGGGVRWETTLTDPGWTFGTNAISSVVAVDIDGVNGPEFIAGTESGRLFAVRATTGTILWSLDLGEAIGDPVVADVDGDGSSEILVPCADGYLYAIEGGTPTRSRAVQH